MPPFPSLSSLSEAQLDPSLTTAIIPQSDALNSTLNPIQVVCAWPVSGQYGPGSRFLYVDQPTHLTWTHMSPSSKFFRN